MKKVSLIIFSLILLTGCDNLMNTPTKQVEELFSKYQMVDEDIKNELNWLLDRENFTLEQKADYQNIIENQYKNLVYTIKDEEVDGNTAVVTAEIEVFDYKKTIDELDNEYATFDDLALDNYVDEKIKRLKEVNDKIKYTLEIEVNKDEDGNWEITDLTEIDIKKIQGMY